MADSTKKAFIVSEETTTPLLGPLRKLMATPNKQPPFTILIDRREQTPFLFEGIRTEPATLKAGDYSIRVGDESYADRVAVERKSKNDGWQCMADSRARFERCAERLAQLDRALIVIECSLENFCIRPHQIERVNVASAVGGYISIMVRYGIPIIWADNRAYAERVTARWLASYWKHRGHLNVKG